MADVVSTSEYENLIVGVGERTYEGVLAGGQTVVRGQIVGRGATDKAFQPANDTIPAEAIVVTDVDASDGNEKPLALYMQGDFNIEKVVADSSLDMDRAKIDLAIKGIFLREVV
jgi:hypothetical protein